MSKRLRLILSLSVIVLVAILLSISRIALPTAPEKLSVQVEPVQVGPHIVAQSPIVGQRLDLSPVIQFTFDRDMDREKTSQAFSLLGSDKKAVPGKTDWLDARTMEFTPDAKLEPASDYKAVFSTQAAAVDSTSPKEDLSLDFTTVENLQVGQVFPAADAEDMDGKTNVTVIFNRPIVPLNIKEEQSGLPQPLEFTPQVKGQGQWVNSSVYVFQPDPALLSGTRYTVRVGAGLKDTTGNQLDKSYVWQFATRAPGIDHVGLKNGAENLSLDNVENVLLDQSFIVTFLQPMDAASLAKAVTIVNRETGASVHPALTWNKDGTVLTIQPSGRYQIASYYTLQIANTAQAQDGGNLKDGLTVKFSTVPLPQIVSVTPEAGSQATSFDSSLSIKFASPMRLDSLKGRVVITPAPKDGAAVVLQRLPMDLWHLLVGARHRLRGAHPAGHGRYLRQYDQHWDLGCILNRE